MENIKWLVRRCVTVFCGYVLLCSVVAWRIAALPYRRVQPTAGLATLAVELRLTDCQLCFEVRGCALCFQHKDTENCAVK